MNENIENSGNDFSNFRGGTGQISTLISYCRARWNRNGNKATAPSKNSKKDNKVKRESNNKRPSGNRADHRTSPGRRNKSKVSVGTDNNEVRPFGAVTCRF